MRGKSTEDEDADEDGAGDSTDKEEEVDATDPLRDRAPNCGCSVGRAVFAEPVDDCRGVEATRRWTFVLI